MPGGVKRKSKKEVLYNKIEKYFLPEKESPDFILPVVTIDPGPNPILLLPAGKPSAGEILS